MSYRELRYLCPACAVDLADVGGLSSCPKCRGTWISDAMIAARMQVVRGSRELRIKLVFSPPDTYALPASRNCPACRQALTRLKLGDIAVERCAAGHGVWFDTHEFEQALLAAQRGIGMRSSIDVDFDPLTPFDQQEPPKPPALWWSEED